MGRKYGGNYDPESAKRIGEKGYSQIFEVIKTYPQRLDPSYTSSQLVGILDFFLYSALRPIIERSTFFDQYVAALATAYAAKDTRRLSNLTVWEFSTLNMVYQLSPIEFRVKGAHKLKINWLLLSLFLDISLGFCEEYKRLIDLYYKTGKFVYKLKANEILLFLGAREDIYGLANEITYWLRQYANLYQQITEKYYRLAINHVSYLHKTSKVPLDDLVQVAVEVLIVALARYDVDKGPITTFIQSYLRGLDSKSLSYTPHLIFSSTSGVDLVRMRQDVQETPPISYEELTETTREEERKGTPLEIESTLITPEITLPSVENQDVSRLRSLIQYADPLGIGQFVLGITHLNNYADSDEETT